MPPEEGDVAHLWDMLEAARTVCELARGYTPEQYLSDRRTQLAVERAIEIIGEAARGVTDRFKEKHPDMAHDYALLEPLVPSPPQ